MGQRIAWFGLLVSLGGCVSLEREPPPKPKTTVVMNAELADAQLRNALARNAATPTEAGLVGDARVLQADMKAPDGAVSISFSGEAATLLERIARAQGLKFAITGPQPRLPLFVTLSVKNATWGQVYRDVGTQFGQRADLVLHNDGLEIRYRGNF